MYLGSVGAVIDLVEQRRWSAKELEAEVTRRAYTLYQNGVSERSIVALLHGGTAQFVADLLAVWMCGGTAACLDPSLTPFELDNLVSYMQPAVILTRRGQSTAIQGRCTIDLSVSSGMAQKIVRADSKLDDPALLLFTSGTTGQPKGVLLSFRAILARIALNAEVIGQKTLSKTLVTLPTHFGHGLIGNTLTPLLSGGTIVMPTLGVPLAKTLVELIDQHDITFMSSVPVLWQMVLFISPQRRPTRKTLSRVHVGSAPLSSALWQRIADWAGCEVVNCYGITETCNWIAGASSTAGFQDGKVGRVWGGRVGILNENGTICHEGNGEIMVQTPAAMLGYFQRPDLTSSILADGWYRTGDVGTIDAKGAIVLKGRVKDEINRAGFKIQPADIDMLLESHSSIAESCCFGEPDAVSEEIVSVAVRLVSGAKETRESLRLWCENRIRRQAIPERWYFVDHIPRTERGKINREKVRQRIVEKD